MHNPDTLMEKYSVLSAWMHVENGRQERNVVQRDGCDDGVDEHSKEDSEIPMHGSM